MEWGMGRVFYVVYVFLITYHPLPITHYLSPITYYLLPITYHLSPITYYLFLSEYRRKTA